MNLKRFKTILHEQASFNLPKDIGRPHDLEAYAFVKDVSIKSRVSPKQLIISLASLCLFVLVSFGLFFQYNPVTTLTMDVNPTFEIKLNVFNRVIDIIPHGDLAADVLEEVSRKTGDLDRIINDIYTSGIQNGVFSAAEAYLLFGVNGQSHDKEQKLKTQLLTVDVASKTTVYVLNKHSEPSETFSFHFARLASAESMTDQQSPAYSTAIATTAIGGENDGLPTTENHFDSIFVADAELYNTSGALSESEFLALAMALQITEAKLQLVLEVFFHYEEYDSDEDLLMLAALELKDLFALHENVNYD